MRAVYSTLESIFCCAGVREAFSCSRAIICWVVSASNWAWVVPAATAACGWIGGWNFLDFRSLPEFGVFWTAWACKIADVGTTARHAAIKRRTNSGRKGLKELNCYLFIE